MVIKLSKRVWLSIYIRKICCPKWERHKNNLEFTIHDVRVENDYYVIHPYTHAHIWAERDVTPKHELLQPKSKNAAEASFGNLIHSGIDGAQTGYDAPSKKKKNSFSLFNRKSFGNACLCWIGNIQGGE